MPFSFKGEENASANPIGFDVHFDVIEGDLPFLLGLPSLTYMVATISLKYMTLSLSLAGKYCRLHLEKDDDHVYLPFEGNTTTPSGEDRSKMRGGQTIRGGRQYYMPEATLRTNLVGSGEETEEDVANQDSHSTATHSTYLSELPKATSSRYVLPITTGVNGSSPKSFYAPTLVKIQGTETEKNGKSLEASPSIASVMNTNGKSLVTDPLHAPLVKTTPLPKRDSSESKQPLTKKDIKKIHVQLRHASYTALKAYISAAKMWRDEMTPILKGIIE